MKLLYSLLFTLFFFSSSLFGALYDTGYLNMGADGGCDCPNNSSTVSTNFGDSDYVNENALIHNPDAVCACTIGLSSVGVNDVVIPWDCIDPFLNTFTVSASYPTCPETCPDGQAYNPDTNECELPPCTPPSLPTLENYLNESLCTDDLQNYSSSGFTDLTCFENCDGNGFDLYGNYPTQDSDGDGYTDYNELQAGTDPNDAGSYPDSDLDSIPLSPECLTIPLWGQDVLGLQKTALTNNCNTYYFNVLFEGDSQYVSSTDSQACSPDYCLLLVKSCLPDTFWNTTKGVCTSPLEENLNCVKTDDFFIGELNGICQKNMLCEDGSVYDNYIVDCAEASTDNNITQISESESMKIALEEYNAATTTKQDEAIEETKQTNKLLKTIELTIQKSSDSNHNDLNKIDNSLSTVNTSINSLNSALNSIAVNTSTSATNSALSANSLASIDSKLSGVLDGINNGLFSDGVLPSDSNGSSLFNDLITNATDAISGFQEDIENAVDEIDNKKTLIENGFVLNGGKSRTESCPFTRPIVLNEYKTVMIEVDYCDTMSSFYDSGYIISYLSTVVASLSFIFMLIVGL